MIGLGQFIIESAGMSDVGLQRRTNEDAFLLLESQGVFCVADGVGGSERSELASRAVIEHLRDAFSPSAASRPKDHESLARSALDHASAWIHEQAQRPGTAGMASTAVILILPADDSGDAATLHAGDSRCYRSRNGHLKLCTHDHSAAELVGIRDERRIPERFRHLITRAVGTHSRVDLERTAINARDGDLFLLCSDGLNRMLTDQSIASILHNSNTDDLHAMATQLIKAANLAGGADNVTVILARLRLASQSGNKP